MINPLNSSLSALSALGKKIEVTSNNIANANTEDFKRSRADLVEGVNGGVEVDIRRIDAPGQIVTDQGEEGSVEKEMPNVDMAQEITQTMMARRVYEANVEASKTEDEMLGTLINIMS